MATIARRDFLKAAPIAAGAMSAIGTAASTRGLAADDLPTAAARDAATPRIGDAAYEAVLDYPIQPKPSFEVTITDGFWRPKLSTNAEVTIPFEVRKLSEPSETPSSLNRNALEAAILSLKTHPNLPLQRQVDARIQEMMSEPGRGNEGFEVATAYFNLTGNRTLLDKAIKSADALYDDFALNDPPFSGGERDAINCVQLYRVTHDKKHLDLAKHYLDIRGLESSVNRSRHNQSYKPVLEQREAVGHAVNCVSLMVSLVDVGVLTGLDPYLDAAKRLWADVVEKKMYITGGVGATGNEGFGAPYSLPNISAYSETCAVSMFITLNHRLFMATGDSKYIDVMERGMYNNAIDGVSTNGKGFFYVNRLASAGDGRDLRWERASLECCPPNLVRFLASMPGFVYAQDKSRGQKSDDGSAKDAIYVNLYASSRAAFTVGAHQLTLSMDSEMPWGGKSAVAVSTNGRVRATIKLRIPGWARNRPVPSRLYRYLAKVDTSVTLAINGRDRRAVPDEMGYVSLEREWTDGEVITIEFPLAIRKVLADERVVENRRRVAIERGPIVYCAEWPDVVDGRVLGLVLDPRRELSATADETVVPGGGAVTAIHGDARAINDASQRRRAIKLIPYYLWANRGAGEMSVWLSTSGYAIGDIGPAGGVVFYENPSYAADGWRYLEAAPFDQSGGAKWGCFRRSIAGARGTAVGTGRQNTLDMLAACAEPGTAAELCAHLTVNGVGGWFLPSRDELALMHRNLVTTGLGDFRDGGVADNFTYWSSSQQTADMAGHIDFADLGRQHSDDKDFPRRVRAIRAI